MEFTKVVAERYSCKNFSTRKVEAEKLTEILEAGRLAPTAKNFQEQRIYVLQSEESLAKLDKVTPCRYGAPTCLVVAFDKNSVFTYPGGKRDSGVEDAAIVATHLMLAAANAGVDSCWLNFFDPDELAKELGLPMQIHDRDSHREVIETLLADGAPERTVFHSYSGDREMAEIAREHGWYLSFSGTVSYKGNDGIRESLRIVGLDHAMVETDAPYLTPMPYRGRTNAPYMIPYTLRAMADTLDLPIADVARGTRDTARAVYGL